MISRMDVSSSSFVSMALLMLCRLYFFLLLLFPCLCFINFHGYFTVLVSKVNSHCLLYDCISLLLFTVAG